MYNNKYILIFFSLITDAFLILFALDLAIIIKFWNESFSEDLVPFLPGVIALKLFIYAICGLYSYQKHKRIFDYVYEAFWAESLAVLSIFGWLLYVQVFVRPEASTSRGLLFYFWLLSFLFIASWRVILKLVVKSREDMTVRMLVVGGNQLSGEVKAEITEYSQLGHEVIGFINCSEQDRINGESVLGNIDDLPKIVLKHKVDEIILLSQNLDQNHLVETIKLCRDNAIILRIMPNIIEVMVGQVQMQDVAGIPLIELRTKPLAGWFRFFKRLVDIIVAALLILASSPVLILTAVGIKLSSKGPVFYKQERLGYLRRVFIIRKFRTMVNEAEKLSGPVLAENNDPRITPLGRFLRKTRIDELPQLFNVLKGDMSLVGPRPERAVFVNKFLEDSRFYERRFEVKPGITGLAQIHGRYDSDFQHKLRYDLAYINNLSPILDIKIMFSTIKVVLTGRGAQ